LIEYNANMERDQIIQEAMALSPDDRAIVANRLWESLQSEVDPEIEKAWLDEFERRLAAYERGETRAFSLDQAMEILKERRVG
jgi:putative addiction module component (TIGR02574 family)